MGGNHHFKALKHTAGKHANVSNGDEIGIVRPLKHSQWGPTRVLPAFGAENFFFGRPMKPVAFLLAKNASKRVGGCEDSKLSQPYSHQPLAAF
jgi:hypothetical protein